jgi:putative transposase
MPQPTASEIVLSQKQKHLLEKITRAHSNPYRLVQRAQLVLYSASGMTNTEISLLLQLTRNRVRLWRNRWQEAARSLNQVESEGIDDEGLHRKIILLLMDGQRPGNPGKFSLEEIVQIIALACELPATSELPVTHWTPKELALEAVKRGIVTEISPRSVGRFLKSSDVETTSQSLLAKCKSPKSRSI